MLRARLLDARGQTLPRATVAVHVAEGRARLAKDLVADERGIVTFRAPRSPGRGRGVNLLFLAQANDTHWHGQAYADLRADAEPMLGDVLLHEPPLLVAGVCVDRDGRVRENVALRVQAEQTGATDKSGRRAGAWVDLPLPAITSQSDGSFRVLGDAPRGVRLRLVAVEPSAPACVFAAGTSGVHVVLPARTRWPSARGFTSP
jgi:hypothetical protein